MKPILAHNLNDWFFFSLIRCARALHPVVERIYGDWQTNKKWAKKSEANLLVKLFLTVGDAMTKVWWESKQNIYRVAQQNSSNCTKKTKVKHQHQKRNLADFFQPHFCKGKRMKREKNTHDNPYRRKKFYE